MAIPLLQILDAGQAFTQPEWRREVPTSLASIFPKTQLNMQGRLRSKGDS
jgi:hypothetical protein